MYYTATFSIIFGLFIAVDPEYTEQKLYAAYGCEIRDLYHSYDCRFLSFHTILEDIRGNNEKVEGVCGTSEKIKTPATVWNHRSLSMERVIGNRTHNFSLGS